MELRKAPLFARNAAQGLVDLVLPHRCLRCGVVVARPGGICGTCWQAMTFLQGFDLCRKCGVPLPHHGGNGICNPCALHPPVFDGAAAALLYDDASRPLVLGLKHGDRLDLVPPLAEMMSKAAAPLLAQVDALVPVPIHQRRLLSRRFNQAAELARQIEKQTGVPMMAALQRTRPTASQSGGRAQRSRNVKDAFGLSEHASVKGRAVALIDDVLTTGATADECARVLKKAGASKVYLITLARAPLPEDGAEALGLIDLPV